MMARGKVEKWTVLLAMVQGGYSFVTAIWALADIESFMTVTGTKTDIWLVKTVAVLLIPISVCLLTVSFVQKDFWLPMLLGSLTAAGLAAIDFYYTATGTIRSIYRADGYLEILFLGGWIAVFFRRRRVPSKK